MPQYLLAGYLPDNFDPSTQDEAMMEEIHALNREMIAAGVRKFAGGLGPTKTLRLRRSVLFGGGHEENLSHLHREAASFGALARPRHRFVHVSAFQYP